MFMRIKNLNSSGFSLLEILLASIIFIISVGGIFVTIAAVRRPVMDRGSSLAASVFGKQVLEALRSRVDASTYYGLCTLNANGHCPNFDLFLGIHEVPSKNFPSGLSWPASISYPNTSINNVANCYNISNGDTSCLVYTISCADGSNTCSSSGSDMARRIDLTINWPTAT